MKVVITYHYAATDIGCTDDYNSCDIVVDGNLALSLEDAYHDHSSDQCQGFLAALSFLNIAHTVETKQVNDIEN